MGEVGALRLWSYRVLFLAAVLGLVLVLLLPLGVDAGRLPGPDVILAFTLAWAMRRADHLPIVLLAAAMLAVDFLLMRPPGLMAALTVVAVEVIRRREYQWRDLPLPVEWLIGGAIIAAVSVANAVVLALFFVPQASLGQILIRMIFTAAIYPVAALAVRYVFGVTRMPADGEPGGRT
ncbi:MAG: rod shape-determining protein MreD [Paracoccaceae bacterium]|nr:rod shape-determining protein MreD [Paracoccaceae bacterium]